MYKAKKYSIRKEIFSNSLVLSLIILIVFSIFLINILYSLGMSKANEIIKQRNYGINFFIKGYFSEIHNTINALSTNKYIQNFPWIDPTDKQRVLDIYKSVSDSNPNITYLYSGDKSGELFINNYVVPEGYNATERPWYQAALSVMPEITSGLLYEDINTKETLVSNSKALYSKQKGLSGVISIDSSIEIISELLKQRGDEYKSSYSFLARPDGEVILHHDSKYLNRLMSDVLKQNISFQETEGQLKYSLDGKKKIAYYSYIDKADWVIVTVVSKTEIIRPIIWQIFLCILLTGLIAVIVGTIQSSLLSKHFSDPLIALQKRVNAIVSGDWEKNSNYSYPNNEIGVIANEVGQLAEEERERLIKELQVALADIKTLKGLIPICSHCKKIRDDKGYWNILEGYIQEHTDALFSHGICPDCLESIYGEDEWYIKMKDKNSLEKD